MRFIEVQGHRIFYSHERSAKQTINEIFTRKNYHLKSINPNPFIIDCGSNIGIATLFFKIHYPQATVFCFEPDPNAFLILKKNISANNFKDITLINAAVSNTQGYINFFGEIDTQEPAGTGNSIIEAWGKQRHTSCMVRVKAVQLSTYINQTVDFLKLDIEGAEQQVLEELGDKLHLVREIIAEVHQVDKTQNINNVKSIIALLEQYDFNIDSIDENNIDWPVETIAWAKQNNPRMYVIHASNKQL